MPKIDPTVSVGNLLSMATIVVAVIFGYARQEARITRVEDKAIATQADLAALRQERAANVLATEARVRALEVFEGRAAQQLRNIEAGISRIEDQLERISGGQP